MDIFWNYTIFLKSIFPFSLLKHFCFLVVCSCWILIKNKKIENLPRVNTICSSGSPKQTAKILFNFLPQIITCAKTLLVTNAKLSLT